MLQFIKRVFGITNIYINGVKASEADICELDERILKNEDCVVESHITKANALAITTI